MRVSLVQINASQDVEEVNFAVHCRLVAVGVQEDLRVEGPVAVRVDLGKTPERHPDVAVACNRAEVTDDPAVEGLGYIGLLVVGT